MDFGEGTLRDILASQRVEYQRYLGVVAEDFKSQVQLMAESLGGMQRQLTVIRDMVVKNTEDIEVIKMEMSVMKMELSVIRRDLKEKVGRDEFTVLEARVALLEASSRK